MTKVQVKNLLSENLKRETLGSGTQVCQMNWADSHKAIQESVALTPYTSSTNKVYHQMQQSPALVLSQTIVPSKMNNIGPVSPYEDATKTDCASLPTIKTHLNSTISRPSARYMTADIKNFYLANNTLNKPEYMRMHISDIPTDIIQQYKLTTLVDSKGYAYIRIDKGMYRLKQAGHIAHNNLQWHLRKHGYHPCKYNKGPWNHISNSITFVLVVDDFGIQYSSQKDLDHLLHALRERYTISTDMTGANYVGLDITWNYKNHHVDIAMPNYIPDLLQQILYKPRTPEYAPHAYNKPAYGTKIQYAQNHDESPVLDHVRTKRIQKIIGSLLYYGRAVDPTILVALGTLASQQNKPTENIEKAANRLLDYVATYPNPVIRFNASDMVLHTHSDASYLSESKA